MKTSAPSSFESMSVQSEILSVLRDMDIKVPTEVQKRALPAANSGSDVIAVAQTGSGKTLAYALAILNLLQRKPSARAVVLAPSREIAQQIFKVFEGLCRELPVSMVLAIGGLPGAKQTKDLNRLPHIIVATPGRLNDHLLNNKLLLQKVEMIVIDEADRMLDMGFAPQLKSIKETLRGQWQTLMFSATFGDAVQTVAQLFIRNEAVMIRADEAEAPVGTLKQKVIFIDRPRKNDRLLDELNATRGGVIVFTGNQDRCESIGEYLEEYGYESDILHGGLSQGNRNRVMREFRASEIRILVATDLVARGLDVPNVDTVINFDLPYQGEDFLHRIGRTARAGRSGTAITFVTPHDERTYKKIQPYLEGAKETKVMTDFQFLPAARVQKVFQKSAAKTRRPSGPMQRRASSRPKR